MKTENDTWYLNNNVLTIDREYSENNICIGIKCKIENIEIKRSWAREQKWTERYHSLILKDELAIRSLEVKLVGEVFKDMYENIKYTQYD